MTGYDRSNILGFNVIDETSWGITPTGALQYGCDFEEMVLDVDLSLELLRLKRSRLHSDATKGPYRSRFQLKPGYARAAYGDYDWTRLYAQYALGSRTGLTDHPGSFSALVGKFKDAAYAYQLWYGIKVDQLEINAPRNGKPIQFNLNCIAKWMQLGTAKTFTGLQNVTVGADPADITTPVVTWVSKLRRDMGGGLTDWPVRSWKLTVSNNLDPQPDNPLGTDDIMYPLEAGEGINDGDRDIVVEVTRDYGSEDLVAARLLGTPIHELRIPIDTKAVVLEDGIFVPSGFPSIKSGIQETVQMLFKSLSIASL